MRRKIDVSASEMMELRREGLSNKDIAEVLDISVQTVRRYIGAQGCRMERLAAFADKGKKKPVEEESCETKKQMTKPKYVPTRETYKVGEMEIVIDTAERAISANDNYRCITLTYEQAAELVEFLAWAGREKCQEVDDNAEVY